MISVLCYIYFNFFLKIVDVVGMKSAKKVHKKGKKNFVHNRSPNNKLRILWHRK